MTVLELIELKEKKPYQETNTKATNTKFTVQFSDRNIHTTYSQNV